MDRAVGMTNERDKIMRMVLALPALFGAGMASCGGSHINRRGNLQQEFRLGEVKR